MILNAAGAPRSRKGNPKMTTEQKIIRHKVGLLNLAQELGNVSRACKMMGFSRDTFYRYRQLVDEGGFDALVEKTRRKANIKNRVAPEVEDALVELATEQPAFGRARLEPRFTCPENLIRR